MVSRAAFRLRAVVMASIPFCAIAFAAADDGAEVEKLEASPEEDASTVIAAPHESDCDDEADSQPHDAFEGRETIGSRDGALPRQPFRFAAPTAIHRLQNALIGNGAAPFAPVLTGPAADERFDQLCPICGRAGKAAEPSLRRSTSRETALGEGLFDDFDDDEADSTPAGDEKLVPGEPAQVLLDIKRRLDAARRKTGGSQSKESLLRAKSELEPSPEALIKWIRVLDAEHRREQANHELEEELSRDEAPDLDAIVAALRQAGRALDEAADLLEDQNLFERADQLRELATELRMEARIELDGAARDTAEPLAPAPAGGRRAIYHRSLRRPADTSRSDRELRELRGELRRIREAIDAHRPNAARD